MTDDNATPSLLESLLDAVETVINGASWFPDTDVDTEEMLVSSEEIRDLSDAYYRFIDPEGFADD